MLVIFNSSKEAEDSRKIVPEQIDPRKMTLEKIVTMENCLLPHQEECPISLIPHTPHINRYTRNSNNNKPIHIHIKLHSEKYSRFKRCRNGMWEKLRYVNFSKNFFYQNYLECFIIILQTYMMPSYL